MLMRWEYLVGALAYFLAFVSLEHSSEIWDVDYRGEWFGLTTSLLGSFKSDHKTKLRIMGSTESLGTNK
jgi:hypothetical protein